MTSESELKEDIAKWRIELPSSSNQPIVMDFHRIPACPGGFLMGSRGVQAFAEPIHRVVISEDFWMGETPVTQAQFDCWPGAKERGEDYHNVGKPDHPAENLNWQDATDYCKWLTVNCSERFPQGYRFAELPCEAQWEYACRADATGLKPPTDYYTGDGEVALTDAGWFADNSGYETQVVRQKLPNDFGLFDMHGNVWEWCLDRWDRNAYRRRWDGITELKASVMAESFGDAERRLMRGGSIGNSADGCRSAFRSWYWAGDRLGSIGEAEKFCLNSARRGEHYRISREMSINQGALA